MAAVIPGAALTQENKQIGGVMLYRWIVYLHILGAFGFLLAHGGSASATFRVRREKTLDGLRAILQLSNASFGLMYGSLLLMLVAGIVSGFLGRWWGFGWIWVSLGLLIATAVAMYIQATGFFNRLRRASGLPWFDGRRGRPAQAPASPEELARLRGSARPGLTTLLGVLPIVLIVWLMVFKPF
jgi:hypothetical protein